MAASLEVVGLLLTMAWARKRTSMATVLNPGPLIEAPVTLSEHNLGSIF